MSSALGEKRGNHPYCYKCGHTNEAHRSWEGACVWGMCECLAFEMNLVEGSQDNALLESVRAALVSFYDLNKTERSLFAKRGATMGACARFFTPLDEAEALYRNAWLMAFCDALSLEEVDLMLPLFVLYKYPTFSRRNAFAARVGVFLASKGVKDGLEALRAVWDGKLCERSDENIEVNGEEHDNEPQRLNDEPINACGRRQE